MDELEKFVIASFKDVKNKKVTPTTFKFPDHHPWGPEQLKKQYSIVPIADTHIVEFIFATPDVIDQYSTSVIIFSSQLGVSVSFDLLYPAQL